MIDHSESHSKAASVLNRVIAKALNSREEFLLFAGKADSTALYELCMNLKHRRDDFALRLQHEVSALGEEPATDQNFAGWIHKGWARVRLALEQENDYVIAAETIREEESMRLALNEALESGYVSDTLKPMLSAEVAHSESLRDMMEELKAKLEPKDYVDVKRD